MAKQKQEIEGAEVKNYDRAELLELSIRLYVESVAKQGTTQARHFKDAMIKDCIFLAKQFLDVFEVEGSGEEA